MQLVFKIAIMEINIPVENKVMYITNSYFWIVFNKTRYSIVTSPNEKSLILSVFSSQNKNITGTGKYFHLDVFL